MSNVQFLSFQQCNRTTGCAVDHSHDRQRCSESTGSYLDSPVWRSWHIRWIMGTWSKSDEDHGRRSYQNHPIKVNNTVKPVLSVHSKRRPKLVFKTDYRLMQVKSIAECSKGSILQYFRPSLSFHLPFKTLFCLFLSGH